MILSSERQDSRQFADCGTKAYHLALLKEAGFRCPPFICMDKSDLARPSEIWRALEASGITAPFSVRSSADVEDGDTGSFAGQFATFLHVDSKDLITCIEKCLDSRSRPGVSALLSNGGQDTPSRHTPALHVIIQQMLDVQLSGVMFTQNPMGILSETVTVVGEGAGANVVEDLVPTTTYYDNLADGVSYHVSQPLAPMLPSDFRAELLEAREKLEAFFGPGLDVEYAVSEGTLYFLQARKITTLRHNRPVILDNSNIVESYPGLTLPLTADFVTRQYSSIFQGVMTRLSGGGRIARQYQDVFDQMVACYNGRMYYRIDHWYGVIGFLPFSKKIIPLWQEMLGVRSEEAVNTPFHTTLPQKASVAVHTLYYFFCSPSKMRKLNKDFLGIEAEFQILKNRDMEIPEIWAFYEKMQSTVMARWDYTLINDMYTFLHTGVFRWLMRRKGMSEEEVQSLLSGISQLESLRPVQELVSLSLEWKRSGGGPVFEAGMSSYLERFGDRSIGELKLETETFREAPERLMEQILRYADMPDLEMIAKQLNGTQAREDCQSRQPQMGVAGYFLSKARAGIENREISRLNRSRLFGFARSMFLLAGKHLVQQGRLSSERDVFYLTMEELFGDSDGSLQSLVEQRKLVYGSYAAYPSFTRVVFDGEVVQKPCLDSALETAAGTSEILRGTPCSPGKATGEVLLVDSSQPIGNVKGKILVTRSTDPGWAFLLAGAAGLISEQGSLLSHTAIISRELKLPAVVGVRGAVTALKDGDLVELDCETGLVRRLTKQS